MNLESITTIAEADEYIESIESDISYQKSFLVREFPRHEYSGVNDETNLEIGALDADLKNARQRRDEIEWEALSSCCSSQFVDEVIDGFGRCECGEMTATNGRMMAEERMAA